MATRGIEPKNPLHLYRHLLRESSYLPPVSRPYISNRIKSRFRRRRDHQDVEQSIRAGQHDLRFLRAANAGDLSRMRRVLLLTFGRIGKRRRDLVKQLVKPEPPADTAALEQMVKQASAGTPPRFRDWLENWDTQKLRAFTVSQSKIEFANSPRPKLRANKTDPESELPTENSWGRPLPERLARTKLLKGFKQMIHRVLPPIARGEWELLRDLSTGAAPAVAWRVPERRTAAKPLPSGGTPGLTDGESATEHWTEWATKSAQVLKRRESRSMKALTGADTPGSGPAVGIHQYTERAWRRLYYNIWQLTATMEKKPTGQGWDIKWGKTEGTLPVARPAHAEFFNNIGPSGQVITKKAPKAAKK